VPFARVALCAIALFAGPLRADEIMVDGIAAQVGSDIVLQSEVLRMVEPMEARLRAAGAPEAEIAKLRAEGLERMIEWRLIEQVVRQAELYATDAELDSTIETIASENGLTLQQLHESVESQGMTAEQYREQIKRELERTKVVNAMVRSQIRIDEQEVQRLYAERFANQREGGEQSHLRQVLVTYGGDTGREREAACGAVRGALARIRAGEPFEAVAAEVSVVAGEIGGDIGWVDGAAMAGWMKDVVGPLEPGATSDVIELPFACVILQLVERRTFKPLSYAEAKPQLEEEVYARHMEEKYTEWMEKLRENTYIERKGHFADAATLRRSAAPAMGDGEEPVQTP
jgi:peptidyl-prolyl cis-trans isomerase SurA